MMTLEQIIAHEQEKRHEDGMFGIEECKDSIRFQKEVIGTSYFAQLEAYVDRANRDRFFNKAMVLACWELINGK